jgi:uncharacterized protein (TIGR03435 family)
VIRQLILVAGAMLLAWQAFGRDGPASNAPPTFAFEVSVIKPVDMTALMPPGCPMPCRRPAFLFMGSQINIEEARVEFRSVTLARLIQMAYRLPGFAAERLTGPDWMDVDRFDITATIPAGVSKYHVPEMLQAMLAERFHLTVRHYAKDTAVLYLVAGKDGVHLPESSDQLDENERLYFPGVEGPTGYARGTLANDGSRHYEWNGITMANLAELLTVRLDRPVIDKTGLPGRHQFSWDVPKPSNYPSDPTAGIRKAIKRSGLRLEHAKAPVEALAVERLDRVPTEN